MHCSTPDFLVLHYLLEFAQTPVHWIGDAIHPSHPLSSLSPAFNVSSIRVLCNESTVHIRWPKFWNFSFSICPSNEYSGLISFRIDWFDLHAVQENIKSLLQHQFFATQSFFIVQLSHPYMSTGKAVTLIIHTFVGKVMSLLFNMLSRFVIAFLLRNKHLLISWLQSPYAFIWNPRK